MTHLICALFIEYGTNFISFYNICEQSTSKLTRSSPNLVCSIFVTNSEILEPLVGKSEHHAVTRLRWLSPTLLAVYST